MLFTIFSGILFFIALLCLGIVLLLNFRGFYHLLAGPLHIMSESGLTREVVFRNYDHLIHYCSPFCRSFLSFPDFPSSDSALSHFAETKVLFSYFYLAVPICCLLGFLLIGIKAWGRAGVPRYFSVELSRAIRVAAWLCFLFPLACLLLFLTDFQKAFYGMHHIFFRNNDWIFNAATDPVITILPERYFLCCGIGIAVFLLFAAAGLACARRHLDTVRTQKNRHLPILGRPHKYGHIRAVKRRPAAADGSVHPQQPEQ